MSYILWRIDFFWVLEECVIFKWITPRQAAGYQNSASWRSSCIFVYTLPCPLTCFIIISSLPCFPTLLAKYPLVQNSPPRNCFLTSEHLRNISRPVMLLITLTTSDTDLVGTLCTKKWTWSSSAPISKTWSHTSSLSQYIRLLTHRTHYVVQQYRYIVVV